MWYWRSRIGGLYDVFSIVTWKALWWQSFTYSGTKNLERQHFMKKIVKRLLGEELLGVIDYYRFPEDRTSWGGALNGQKHRQFLVEAFLSKLCLDAIVETGTYRGTTTAYLATLSLLPIYTVEYNSRYYGFSLAALRRFDNVHLFKGDSCAFLNGLVSKKSLAGKRVLFYLDAHWGGELPLLQELCIIFSYWDEAVVLIDDFKVPDDSGFGYDDYGAGNSLELSYLMSVLERFQLSVFFPSVSSDEENGEKRGSVTLANHPAVKDILLSIPELREYPKA